MFLISDSGFRNGIIETTSEITLGSVAPTLESTGPYAIFSDHFCHKVSNFGISYLYKAIA